MRWIFSFWELHDKIRKTYFVSWEGIMNRNQLKYFVAAAESRSFTKAAEQFYISQTAITQQIRLLEETLGCPLFDRSTRPVSLTSAGTIFLLPSP